MLRELLPVYPSFEPNYLDVNKRGIDQLNNAKVTVLSLTRNNENRLQNNINVMKNFFKEHNTSYNLVFFENDSTDKTVEILEKNKQESPTQFHYFSEQLGRKQFGPVKQQERVQALAEYRNKLLEYARGLDSQFIIVMDSDFDEISLDGLTNSFGWLSIDTNIAAVAGNSFEYKTGIFNSERYNLWNYDSWAFRHTWWLDLNVERPAPNNVNDAMIWFGLWIPPTGSSPITVNSAFGGTCIYRSDVYFKGQYGSTDCEHVCFHQSLLVNTNYKFKMVLNPSQQMLFKVSQ